jgi:hypothetical protein
MAATETPAAITRCHITRHNRRSHQQRRAERRKSPFQLSTAASWHAHPTPANKSHISTQDTHTKPKIEHIDGEPPAGTQRRAHHSVRWLALLSDPAPTDHTVHNSHHLRCSTCHLLKIWPRMELGGAVVGSVGPSNCPRKLPNKPIQPARTHKTFEPAPCHLFRVPCYLKVIPTQNAQSLYPHPSHPTPGAQSILASS